MKRNYSLDKMKFYCIIAIVCLHTTPFQETKVGWIINVLCKNAVPLFFICSGYWFYAKYSRDYAKKYFLKITKLFICWSIFYIILDLICLSILNNSLGLSSLIKYYFSGFNILRFYYCGGIIKFHLWYLSATLVVLPLLYVTIKDNLLSKILITGLILNILGVFLYNIEFPYVVTTRDGLFLGLFYMTLGAYIKSNEEYIKIKMKSINDNYLYFIIMFIIISFFEKFIYDTYFVRTCDYLVSTIPLSFLIFMRVIFKNDNKDSVISKIGRNSVGIYVIHIAFMDILDFILFKSHLLSIKESILFQILYTPILIIVSYLSYKLIISIKDNIVKR